MKIALVSLHSPNYHLLSELTWTKNKKIYAERHNYLHFCKTKNFYNINWGYEKILFLRDLMIQYDDINWFWWSGCDSLITNFTISLEKIIDDNFCFIVSTDCRNINVDSFLLKNNKQSLNYINDLIKTYTKYQNQAWAEQQAIIDSYEYNNDIIKILPQKILNSYDYSLYNDCQPYDKFGKNGQWEKGDLIIHWPGTSLWKRIELASKFSSQIIY
jgi:hypothetical protein